MRVRTGAGIKHLRLLGRDGLRFGFEMNMGQPEIRTLRHSLPLAGGSREVTLLWVGNPQCAMPVDDFDFDWRAMGAAIERHPEFPNRTNVIVSSARWTPTPSTSASGSAARGKP